MRLRNKKTGEIAVFGDGIIDLGKIGCANVAEMMEAGWEDYEERPYDYWYVEGFGSILHHTKDIRISCDYLKESYERQEQIGNHFKTKKEAEKAVEKLKAITRLNKCNFKFEGYADRDRAKGGDIVIYAHVDTPNNNLLEEAQPAMLKDLDLLFGGEE